MAEQVIAIRRENLVHAFWLPVFLAVFAPTLVFLWDKLTRNVWHNGHGIFVPILVAFLVHFALTHREFEEEEASPWGFVFLGGGLLLVTLDSAIHTQLLSAFALIFCLPGISLLLLGVQRTRALLLPWILCFFLLPIPSAFLDSIHMTLRIITTEGTSAFYRLLGVPHVTEGTDILLPVGRMSVVDACSGFSALYAAVTIALVLIYITKTPRRRVLLALLPVPLAIGFNIVRVSTMILLCNYVDPGINDTWVHTALGWSCFVAALVVLFAIADHGAPKRATT